MTTEIFFPTGVKVQGNDKIVAMVAVADDSAPSIATEINAATSVELTKAMYGAWDALKNVDKLYPNYKLGWSAFIAHCATSIQCANKSVIAPPPKFQNHRHR